MGKRRKVHVKRKAVQKCTLTRNFAEMKNSGEDDAVELCEEQRKEEESILKESNPKQKKDSLPVPKENSEFWEEKYETMKKKYKTLKLDILELTDEIKMLRNAIDLSQSVQELKTLVKDLSPVKEPESVSVNQELLSPTCIVTSPQEKQKDLKETICSGKSPAIGAMEVHLKKHIMKVFPGLNENHYEDILHTFFEMGVESEEDIKYLKEEDLQTVLNPVQIRRLLHSTKIQNDQSDNVSQVRYRRNTLQVCSRSNHFLRDATSEVESSLSENSLCDDWVKSYVFTASILKKDIQLALLNKEKLVPQQRRELVRAVVNDILRVSVRPLRRELRIIASKLVGLYPKSLQDVLDGHVLGTGYDSLLRQLNNRVENALRDVRRKGFLRIRKRSVCNGNQPSVHHPRKQPTLSDSRGCINFNPAIYDVEAMTSDQSCLEYLFHNSDQNNDVDVQKKLIGTFPLQRCHINDGHTIPDLLKEWPFLFEEVGLMCHLKELLGKDLRQTMEEGFAKWVQKSLDYFNNTPSISSEVNDIMKQIKVATKDVQNQNPKIAGFVLAVLTYFQECASTLIQVNCAFEEMTTGKLIEGIPSSPCILVTSDSFLTSDRFAIAIDGYLVNAHIQDVSVAIISLFGSFYVFNIEYPTTVSSTLEFFQRCLACINSASKTRNRSVKPKVLKLINLLDDFAWTPV